MSLPTDDRTKTIGAPVIVTHDQPVVAPGNPALGRVYGGTLATVLDYSHRTDAVFIETRPTYGDPVKMWLNRSEVHHAEPEGTFSLDAVVKALQEAGIPAYVEQTGGGCATIYAGGVRVVQDGDYYENRWIVAAGPGYFNGPNWTHGRGYLSEFYVGPNDDEGDDSESLPEDFTPEQAVAWAVEKISTAVASLA